MKSIFSVFQKGFQKTATTISRTFTSVFSDVTVWDNETYKNFERALLQADFGVAMSKRLVSDIKDRYERGLIKTTEDIVNVASSDIDSVLSQTLNEIKFEETGPTVILLVGVNGSGKTTTAGKLANLFGNQGKKVFLAACDTFRAAAVEQLTLWSERTNSQLIAARQGADPASVAFDAVTAAQSRGADVLIIDTAGRQHTRKGLMDELNKMVRVIKKVMPNAPHYVLLTIDSSVGGNALIQAREFAGVAGVTGLVLTKLDGTGRGGIVVAIQDELKLPVHFVGLGEQPDDLQPFDPNLYIKALFTEAGCYLESKNNS